MPVWSTVQVIHTVNGASVSVMQGSPKPGVSAVKALKASVPQEQVWSLLPWPVVVMLSARLLISTWCAWAPPAPAGGT